MTVPATDWILNRPPSKRLPLYTRSNAGEVMGLPVSPLGWTLIWEAAFEPGTADGYVSFGAFTPEEMSEQSGSYGMFGGYFYLNLSAIQIVSERLPNLSAAEITAAFDPHPDMPPFEPQGWHKNAQCMAQLETFADQIATSKLPSSLNMLHENALQLRKNRPDFAGMSDKRILAHIRSILPAIRRNGELHVTIGQGGMIATVNLQKLLYRLNRLEDMVRLNSGIGGVESGEIARHLWRLSRMVRRSDALRKAFQGDLTNVLARIDDPEFLRSFEEFIQMHGSRSTNEWDLIADTFETDPVLALAQIEVMARQDDHADPVVANDRNAKMRADLIKQVLAGLPDNATTNEFTQATDALAAWFAGRERSKNLNIRTVHEVRMCVRELARRALEAGALENPIHIFMLLEVELDDFVAQPSAFRGTLADRYQTFVELHDKEPPFVVYGSVPPVATWPKREQAKAVVAKPGDVLTGMGCSPGKTTGIARVVLDAGDPSMLEPGDILITPTTNPSWTPLFLAAGAVITEFGLFNSHASIVCRELGIPCVASVPNATRTIPDGATIVVNGDAGRVEILSVPIAIAV